MNILLTGGAGYIGSHIAVALLEHGHHVVLVDNFTNSSKEVVRRIEHIASKKIRCIELDIRDTFSLIKVIKENDIASVIHLAGLKSVSESNQNPLEYYSVNVQGSISLLEAMRATQVRHIVFSSSATVYGEPKYLPIDEKHPIHPESPYGRSKHHIECILEDLQKSDISWKIGILRYFNPVGAHPSGLIGEEPVGQPNNLMPLIAQAAGKEKEKLTVYGGDYATKDGTGVRDYIHVMDLANGHLASIKHLFEVGSHVVNLGTGIGYSVLEVIEAYKRISQVKIEYSIAKRREGDVAKVYACTKLAKEILGWRARHNLDDTCATSWLWQSQKKKV